MTDKGQFVRVLDMLLIGPFLLKLSGKKGMTRQQDLLLKAIGIGTVLYNGYFFVQNLPKDKH